MSPVSQPNNCVESYPRFHCLLLIQILSSFKKIFWSKPTETSVTFNLVNIFWSLYFFLKNFAQLYWFLVAVRSRLLRSLCKEETEYLYQTIHVYFEHPLRPVQVSSALQLSGDCLLKGSAFLRENIEKTQGDSADEVHFK